MPIARTGVSRPVLDWNAMTRSSTAWLLPASLLLVALLSACSSDSSSDAAVKERKARAAAHLVELATVASESLQFTAEREGTLRAIREVKIFNQEEGRVTAVLAHEGDTVKPGQVLIRLDDRLLRAELDKAVASLHQEKLNVERLERLMVKKLVSEDALTRARTSLEIARAQERALRTRVGYMTIAAPFLGKVAHRLIEPGDVAPKHTHLMTVVDPSALVTDVQISELMLPHLKVGDRAAVRIDALGDPLFPGAILRIYPTVDPATRRGQIEVALKPVPPGARPGLFCRVTLYSAGRRQVVIPYSALRRDDEGEFVFLYTPKNHDADNGRVRRAAVRSGLRLADKVAVQSGLAAGQRVVAKGFIGLVDGELVRPVTQPALRKAPTKGRKKAGGANDA